MAAVTSKVGPTGASACCGAPIETHSGLLSSYARCSACKARVS